MATGMSPELIEALEKHFQESKQLKLAQNVCTTIDPMQICMVRKTVQDTNHQFQYTVPPPPKPITNQQTSGRCWIFACLNMLRLPFMKAKNIEEFEFSQSYLFFWDKVERCNYMLNAFVETAKRREPVDGRLVQFLLANPTQDGGQWDMLVNLIDKYGIVPKQCFPESFSSEASQKMNDMLNRQMKANCQKLRKMVEEEKAEEEVNNEIQSMMKEVYSVVNVCLGTTPKTIHLEYREKETETYHEIGPMSPQDFYVKIVKPLCDIKDKICLVNDPRPNNSYEKLYTVEFLGNMVGGRATQYNNQPIQVLKEAAAKSIKDGEAVWFGCDVGKQSSVKLGINDTNLYDLQLIGLLQDPLDKANRLMYGDSFMTHAMILTGVSNKKGTTDEYTKWRVENSWGKDSGHGGFLTMSDEWFTEYVFEVVVDKKYLTADILEVMEQEPTVLPAWDPMGALA